MAASTVKDRRVMILIPMLKKQGGRWDPNPELTALLNQQNFVWRMIVCLDDGTPYLTTGEPVEQTRAGSRGKGESLRAGIQEALKWNANAVVFCDADAYSPYRICEISVMSLECPVVIANRPYSGHRSSLYRRVLHQIVKRLLPPFGVDTQSGLKGFQAEVLQAAVNARPTIFCGRYEYDLRLFRFLRSENVPLKLVHTPELEGSGGATSVRPAADLWPCLKALLFEKRPRI